MKVNYIDLLSSLKGKSVPRPNKVGTLFGHAAGEPFEKVVYSELKKKYPHQIFKQFEYLNDLYTRSPKAITLEDRNSLLNSPTIFYLLTRGEKATKNWSVESLFEEKQNDTADIIYHNDGYFELIDIKTTNLNKNAQPPNIISAYKLANMCARMIDNEDFDIFEMFYLEIGWLEKGGFLICKETAIVNLFKINPSSLYINWVAAMQIQFKVSQIRESWKGNKKAWAIEYLRHFIESARIRCKKMEAEYITPFLKYIE